MIVARLALASALIAAQIGSFAGATSAAGTRVTVPDGTTVDVAPVTILGTNFDAKGSTFEVVVKKDVVVNGLVVVSAGAKGEGTIVDSIFGDNMRMMPQEQDGPAVQRAGAFAVEGKDIKGPPFRIRIDWVKGVDGLKLRVGNITTEGDSNGNPAQASPAPDYFLQTVTKMKKRSIFNMNPTVDYSVKSGAGTIPPSQVFTARIVGPVHTVTSIKEGEAGNDGFAH